MNASVQYAKEKMNLEFGYIMEVYCEYEGSAEDGTIEDFTVWFDQIPYAEEGREGVESAMSELAWAAVWGGGVVAQSFYNCEYLHNPNIKIDMIKNIERNEILDVVVRPLQIKIKEMLYSPHTKRGRAFIEKQISWAFEE